jgi:hypothetical protein
MGWIKLSVDETCHVVWAVRSKAGDIFLHAIGDGAEGNRVTREMARKRFDGGKCKTPWMPVIFPERAVFEQRRSMNCVTAAAVAVFRGWFYVG